MSKYEILFYKNERGEVPIQDFIDSLQHKVQTKFMKTIELLSDEGSNLKRPYSDYLKEGIRELRIKFSPNEYRALYFFVSGNKIVITHAFVKKTDQVPEEEINRALSSRVRFEENFKREGQK